MYALSFQCWEKEGGAGGRRNAGERGREGERRVVGPRCGHRNMRGEFEVNLGCVRTCLKTKHSSWFWEPKKIWITLQPLLLSQYGLIYFRTMAAFPWIQDYCLAISERENLMSEVSTTWLTTSLISTMIYNLPGAHQHPALRGPFLRS